MFKKVMVANRGEIAVRIFKTLQEMGIKAVALASVHDQESLHAQSADECYMLIGDTLAETYLSIPQIINIAKANGVEAIHPGYGFLSEKAAFSQACADAGIIFIGPSPKVIEAMGDKITAKAMMQKADVPIVPGWQGDVSDMQQVHQEAQIIGYPILVKAAAGGGGKGMRLVHREADLDEAVAAATREAQKAFGDGRVFLEKYIANPRHVEFQILGDHHGNVVHLFERDCSIQRRHQKIIEECPSPALTPQLRETMGNAALNAAKALGYTNAGTVEFIVDNTGNFYFLEVNTRLQVEHPVTEWVTRQDLVRLQVEIAMGNPLPFQQNELTQVGHAIECRIYAEDPTRQFLPSTGKLLVYQEPKGPGIRVDSGVMQGSTVSVHYDPMLSKLTTWGVNRHAALEKMRWALSHYPVLGIETNLSFLQAVMTHPVFQAGTDVDTHFLEQYPPETLLLEVKPADIAIALAACLSQQKQDLPKNNILSTMPSPWLLSGAWRGV